MKYIKFFLIFIYSISSFSVDNVGEIALVDSPIFDFYHIDTAKDKVRFIYQAGAGIIHANSEEDLLVTAPLAPCIGIVINFGDRFLLIHADYSIGTKYIVQLINEIKTNDEANLSALLYSVKVDETTYNRDFLSFHNNLSHIERMQQLAQSLSILMPPENIKQWMFDLKQNFLTKEIDNIAVDKWGNCFHVNYFTVLEKEFNYIPGNISADDNIKILSKYITKQIETLAQLPELANCFSNDAPPFMSLNDIPEALFYDWPVCDRKYCHYGHKLPSKEPLACGFGCEDIYFCNEKCLIKHLKIHIKQRRKSGEI